MDCSFNDLFNILKAFRVSYLKVQYLLQIWFDEFGDWVAKPAYFNIEREVVVSL